MTKKVGISNCTNCPIRKNSIFASLVIEQLENLGMNILDLSAETNETLYFEAENAEYAYVLRQGAAKLTKVLPDGHTHIVRLIGPEAIFGFEGLLENRYHHSATILINSRLCRIPLQDLKKLCHNNEGVREAIMSRWLEVVRQNEMHILNLGAKKAAARLASFIIDWCSIRPYGSWIDLPLNRSEIGEFLGVTTETVSRFLAEWKRLTLVKEQSGQISIPNPDKLIQHATKKTSS